MAPSVLQRLRSLAAVPTLVLSAAAAATGDPAAYAFRVLLDEREIGAHEFRIEHEGGREIVESRADFDVRLLFVNVYSYAHRDREVWEDGCLARLESETDDNGRRFAVRVERREDGTRVETRDDARTVPGCLRTFAYWDPSFLEAERLLNSQDGSLVDVAVTPLGETELRIDGAAVPARGFRVEGEQGLRLTLWYAVADDRWLALESLRDGRVLRYVPREADEVRFPDGSVLAGRG
ncbi:MAG: DUF6134 family protein [Pseudomonadales bacterium]|jgi:hypothetical protein|nr:DUF6134 family protein [Pseudomonadales bacterium]